MKVLLVITGSIAAYKALDVLSLLRKKGCEVETILTPDSRRFVGEVSVEGITGRRSYWDIYENSMLHIDLVRWADSIVVCPATAGYLNRMASGLSQDLASTIFLSHRFDKPFLVFPAMNSSMWEHPATQISVKQLRDWGVQIIDPDSGLLACGESGSGRLPDPQLIVEKILGHTEIQGRVLVTAGGTVQPIDTVRFLTNASTGKTGRNLAQYLLKKGFFVDFLHSRSALPIEQKYVQNISFLTYEDLKREIEFCCRKNQYDYIFHLAAVSDYRVAGIEDIQGVGFERDCKLPSGETILLRLVPNPKLIDMLSERTSRGVTQLIAFKLTTYSETEDSVHNAWIASEPLFTRAAVDFVIHNNLQDFEMSDTRRFRLFSKEGLIVEDHHLVDIIRDYILKKEAVL